MLPVSVGVSAEISRKIYFQDIPCFSNISLITLVRKDESKMQQFISQLVCLMNFFYSANFAVTLDGIIRFHYKKGHFLHLWDAHIEDKNILSWPQTFVYWSMDIFLVLLFLNVGYSLVGQLKAKIRGSCIFALKTNRNIFPNNIALTEVFWNKVLVWKTGHKWSADITIQCL